MKPSTDWLHRISKFFKKNRRWDINNCLWDIKGIFPPSWMDGCREAPTVSFGFLLCINVQLDSRAVTCCTARYCNTPARSSSSFIIDRQHQWRKTVIIKAVRLLQMSCFVPFGCLYQSKLYLNHSASRTKDFTKTFQIITHQKEAVNSQICEARSRKCVVFSVSFIWMSVVCFVHQPLNHSINCSYFPQKEAIMGVKVSKFAYSQNRIITMSDHCWQNQKKQTIFPLRSFQITANHAVNRFYTALCIHALCTVPQWNPQLFVNSQYVCSYPGSFF